MGLCEGCCRLAKGLRKTKTEYPLVVAVLPDVPEEHRQILNLKAVLSVRLSRCTHRRTRPSLRWLIMLEVSYCHAIIARVLEDFLNMFFKDVYKPIPPVYNLVLAMLWRHPENVGFEKVKVVHYCADGAKPWRYTGKEVNMEREDIKLLVKKWWDIYEDESLDYKNAVPADHGKLGSIIVAFTEEEVVHQRSAPSAA
ncbi:hypothetical protein GH714_039696 [Hevea brasiliensis]|uniref:Hexosyltransferase n=1 Tax=Hevea brasiliensis TaxID=3981 RepID=A0A6A6MHF7_HEVBR|nr:hypothetical protein GH714_039696 [Hevea brasiliensis]